MSTVRDHRDICIEQLADDESTLLESLASVSAERDGYRLLAQQAIHLLHEHQLAAARMREQKHHLIEELRAMRNATVRAA